MHESVVQVLNSKSLKGKQGSEKLLAKKMSELQLVPDSKVG